MFSDIHKCTASILKETKKFKLEKKISAQKMHLLYFISQWTPCRYVRLNEKKRYISKGSLLLIAKTERLYGYYYSCIEK